MKITRIKLLEIFGTLEEFAKYAKSVKLSYTIAKNISLLKGEIELIKKADSPSQDFMEYENKRVEVCKIYAVKNENGEPLVENDKFVIENQNALESEVSVLRTQYSSAISGRERQAMEVQQLLLDDVDVEFYQVKPDVFLADGAISGTTDLVKLFTPLFGYIIVE